MKKDIKILLIIFTLSIIQVQAGNAQSLDKAPADTKVIAAGKNFSVTMADVEKVKEFYNRTPIRTLEAEYQSVTVNLLLFVHDAMELHLDKEVKVPSEGPESADYWVLLANAYWKHVVVDGYPVSDRVIESYYRVYPERFEKSGDAAASSTVCLPVDREISQRIRMLILNKRTSEIYQELVARLKNKYSVKTIGFK